MPLIPGKVGALVVMMVCGGKNKLLCGNNKLLIIFYKFLGKFSKNFLNNYHNLSRIHI